MPKLNEKPYMAMEKLSKAVDILEDTENVVLAIQDVITGHEHHIGNLQADNKMLMELLLKHGGHTDDCEYIEDCQSGRLLKESEANLCDCGWSAAKSMIKSRMS